MVVLYHSEQIQNCVSKGEGTWGQVWGKPGASIQESSPCGAMQECLVSPSNAWTAYAQCCLPGSSPETQGPKFLLGTGHEGLFPAYAKISDSQKEGRCSV